MAALPVVAVVLIVLPQSFTDRARVWAGPVFVPFQNLTQGWTLDLAEQVRHDVPARLADETGLQGRLDRLENALAEATVRLAEYDRRLHDLAHLRKALDGLPCRLVPGKLLAPEVGGGRAGGLPGEFSRPAGRFLRKDESPAPQEDRRGAPHRPLHP